MHLNYMLSLLLVPLLHSPTFASEQQPFQFEAMSAPSYSLPELPYAYDVSVSLFRLHIVR